MKFFIDTADTNEIQKGLDLGLVEGVTTNPTLVAQAGRKYEHVIMDIAERVNGPISVEVLGNTTTEMWAEAQKWHKMNHKLVIKLPMTHAGLTVTKLCHEQSIATNLTLCFSPIQALLAAKAGATYVSPFLGRLDDKGENSTQLLVDIRTIYREYGLTTYILAASIRSVDHLVQAAKLGCDAATIPPKVLWIALQHPLTDIGLGIFEADSKRIERDPTPQI